MSVSPVCRGRGARCRHSRARCSATVSGRIGRTTCTAVFETLVRLPLGIVRRGAPSSEYREASASVRPRRAVPKGASAARGLRDSMAAASGRPGQLSRNPAATALSRQQIAPQSAADRWTGIPRYISGGFDQSTGDTALRWQSRLRFTPSHRRNSIYARRCILPGYSYYFGGCATRFATCACHRDSAAITSGE